jgi:hypothetical protein
MVPIVQSAERLTVDQKDVGSSPTGHPGRWPQGHFLFWLLLLLMTACSLEMPAAPTAFATQPLPSPSPIAPPSPTPSPVPPTMTPSPLEGLRIVYSTPGGLWLWQAGQTRPLTSSAADSDPRFSPDGEWLTFQRDQTLWGLHVQDGEARPLVTPDYLSLIAPDQKLRLGAFAWMPGTSNLFFTTLQRTPQGWEPRFDLHVVDARLGQPILILQSGSGGIPFFSPRGAWLALVRAGEIALTATPSLKPRRVFTFKPLPNFLPTLHWLRDESGFVFLLPPDPSQATPTPEPSSPYPALLPTQWWGISIEGKARRLGEFEAETFSIATPVVSPNGDQLLYLYPYRKRGQHEIHIRDVLGNDLFYTSYRYGKIAPLTWLPDELHFIYWADSPKSLWLAHYGEPARPLVTDLSIDALLLADETFFIFRHGSDIFLQTWKGERLLLIQGSGEEVDVFR